MEIRRCRKSKFFIGVWPIWYFFVLRTVRYFGSLLVNCTGYACFNLWDDQIRTVNRLADYYYDNVSYGATATENIGTLARRTATSLCKIEVTGTASYVYQLTVTYNRMLNLLEELQESAQIREPYTCKFSSSR